MFIAPNDFLTARTRVEQLALQLTQNINQLASISEEALGVISGLISELYKQKNLLIKSAVSQAQKAEIRLILESAELVLSQAVAFFTRYGRSQFFIEQGIVKYLKHIAGGEDLRSNFTSNSPSHQGHCLGLSVLWLIAQSATTAYNSAWFEQAVDYWLNIDTILAESPEAELQRIAKEYLEPFLALIDFLQRIDERLPVGQLDVLTSIATVFDATKKEGVLSYLDALRQVHSINHEYTIVYKFDRQQLEQLFDPATGVIKDRKLILISSPEHVVALYKQGDNYSYYDPNNYTKVEPCTKLELIDKYLTASFFDHKAKVFEPLAFRLFNFDQAVEAYPQVSAVLQAMVAHHPIVFRRNEWNFLGLILAVRMNALESVQYILQQIPAQQTARIINDNPEAIFYAIINGDTLMLQELMAFGFPLNIKLPKILQECYAEFCGLNPIMWAAKLGNPDMVAVVMALNETQADELYIDINAVMPNSGMTVLRCAVSSKNYDRQKVLSLLLQHPELTLATITDAFEYILTNLLSDPNCDAFTSLKTLLNESQIKVTEAHIRLANQAHRPDVAKELIAQLSQRLTSEAKAQERYFIQQEMTNVPLTVVRSSGDRETDRSYLTKIFRIIEQAVYLSRQELHQLFRASLLEQMDSSGVIIGKSPKAKAYLVDYTKKLEAKELPRLQSIILQALSKFKVNDPHAIMALQQAHQAIFQQMKFILPEHEEASFEQAFAEVINPDSISCKKSEDEKNMVRTIVAGGQLEQIKTILLTGHIPDAPAPAPVVAVEEPAGSDFGLK